jgi:glycosyltransferase involved in cell wall biosynthesis
MSIAINPKVSVLILTYNHEKFIRQALDSVLMQATDFEVEIVIADDYSLDSTYAIAQKYQAIKGINLLSSDQHLGITRNLQRAFEACRGKYIAVLEGDDFWISPNKLNIVSTFLDQHQEISLCFHRLIRLDEITDRTLVYPMIETSGELTVFTASDLAKGNFVGGLSTCTYRRAVIDSLDPEVWKLKVREWPFNIVVATHGPIGYVPEILSIYRGHTGGCWSQLTLEQQRPILREIVDSYNKYLNFQFDTEFREFEQKIWPPKTKLARSWVAAKMPVRLKSGMVKLLRWLKLGGLIQSLR